MKEILNNYLPIIANIFTITGLSAAAVLGLLSRSRSLTGFKVNHFVEYVLRTGVIIFISIILFQYLQFFYGTILVVIKGSDIVFLWESGKEIQHALSYLITFALGIFLFWLFAPIIWTSSFVYAVELVNRFLPNTFKINIEGFGNNRILHITKAVYESEKDNSRFYDVTDILNSMIKNNSLEITASNELKDDPHKGVYKYLTIDYTINGVSRRERIREGEKKVIPSQ